MADFEAVIFDLDGVLCSTDEYHYQAWKQLANRLGIPFGRQVNNQLRGVSRMESLDIILRNGSLVLPLEERKALAEEKNSTYRHMLEAMSPANLSNEAKNTLDALRQKGYALAVGSSSRNARFILQRLGLADFFDAVADGTDIQNSKPDPEVFLLAARRLGKAPADCLVVEDAKPGVEAAVNGGFAAAGMGDARDDARASYHLNDLPGLLEFL